ncbi:holo-ACP synthase [Cyclobacterium sp. SYSU L10401]|uniref:holo-ACP synthase n=1 Tax=Cyclobacterium sp. SYSU L10401 TaxID=2678657 RepID=UPI0013D81275|nr:4'-phosphopantetheinyl transferase superfamily protein [Cyclobacterium sp. SYSU L10401]
MSQYIGVDLEEIKRFRRLWMHKKHLLHWFYLPAELKKIEEAPKPPEKMAGIWCAKEAVIKAFAPLISLRNLEVDLSQGHHAIPEARILHPVAEKLDLSLTVSISHTREHVIANALLTIND